MIRLIQRRLIIPRGDTGSFSIPLQSSMSNNDIAIFSIYDPLIKKNILELNGSVEDDIITFTFTHELTANLEPKKYLWDVTIYNNPIYDEDNKLIGGEEVNSYYSAFKLPICEIREVTTSV